MIVACDRKLPTNSGFSTAIVPELCIGTAKIGIDLFQLGRIPNLVLQFSGPIPGPNSGRII